MFSIFFFLIILFLYFLPSIAAYGKSFFGQVFLLNLLLGWTFIGWVIALIWAAKKEDKRSGKGDEPFDLERYRN